VNGSIWLKDGAAFVTSPSDLIMTASPAVNAPSVVAVI
jgi:hypothetical protein